MEISHLLIGNDEGLRVLNLKTEHVEDLPAGGQDIKALAFHDGKLKIGYGHPPELWGLIQGLKEAKAVERQSSVEHILSDGAFSMDAGHYGIYRTGQLMPELSPQDMKRRGIDYISSVAQMGKKLYVLGCSSEEASIFLMGTLQTSLLLGQKIFAFHREGPAKMVSLNESLVVTNGSVLLIDNRPADETEIAGSYEAIAESHGVLYAAAEGKVISFHQKACFKLQRHEYEIPHGAVNALLPVTEEQLLHIEDLATR